MNHLEFKEFTLLANALEGKTEQEGNWDWGGFMDLRHDPAIFQDRNYDFSGVFGAILAFAKARFRANEFRELLNDMDNYLNVQGKEHV